MGRHIRQTSDKAWEITVKRLTNGDFEVRAQDHVSDEPGEILPTLKGEEELVNDIAKFLEKHNRQVRQ